MRTTIATAAAPTPTPSNNRSSRRENSEQNEKRRQTAREKGKKMVFNLLGFAWICSVFLTKNFCVCVCFI